MKKLLLLCVLFGAGVPLLAQKVFFIYIQSDAHAPFYVRMGDKVMSSTASGYLILPKLKDSTYIFQLGPAANGPELRFEVPVLGKDRGFLLKKFAEGWSLFDLQSLDKLNPVNVGSGTATGSRLREDRFTTLLVKASDDTSLMYQSVVASVPVKKKADKKEKKSEPRQATAADNATGDNSDSLGSLAQDAGGGSNEASVAVALPENEGLVPEQEGAEKNETVVSIDSGTAFGNGAYKKSLVTRRSEQSTVEGFGLVYLDDVDGVVDTITLMIPNPKVVFADDAPVADTKEAEVPEASAASVVACNAQANEKDYFKLRRSLASVDSESDMTREAVTAFRKKCFSAEQVKNLSALFLTQRGKYGFFEAAYPYVSDRANFLALQSELIDPDYLARFKALISN